MWPPRIHVHKASGQDRVKHKGKHYYLGKAGSEESRRAYAELIARLAQEPIEPARPKAGLTVAELAEQWDEHACESQSDKERRQYANALAALVRLFGAEPAGTITACRLEQVRDEMIRLGWSRKVINRQIVRIRTVWRWAERRGHVPPGAWSGLRVLEPLRAHDKRVRTLPPRKACDWQTLVRVCRKAPATVREMLLVQWYTGARSGEVRQMRAGELDCSGAVWIYRPASHKNAWRGQSREILCGPRCQAVLRRRLAGLAPGDYVFSSTPGHCYTDCTYARAVARAAKRAGVEVFCAYSCRHAFKLRVTREMSLDAARAAMGHRSIEMTAGYAVEVDRQTASEVARRIG